MLSNGRLLKWTTILGLIFLVVSFLTWFGMAVVEDQGHIDAGIDRTRGLLLWEIDFFDGWAPDSVVDFYVNWCSDLPTEVDVQDTDTASDNGPLFRAWLAWADLAFTIWLIVLVLTIVAWVIAAFMAGARGVTPRAATATAGGGGTTTTTTTTVTHAPTTRYDAWIKLGRPFGILLVVWLALKLIGGELFDNILPRAWNFYENPETRGQREPSAWAEFLGWAGSLINIVVALAVLGLILLFSRRVTNMTVRSGMAAADPWRIQDLVFWAVLVLLGVAVVFRFVFSGVLG